MLNTRQLRFRFESKVRKVCRMSPGRPSIQPQVAVPQNEFYESAVFSDDTPPNETGTWNLDPRHSADKGIAQRAFLRMVSHELRTPLNSIIGFSDILSQQIYGPLGNPQYVEYAEIIRDSGTKLLGLFNNVLEVIRLEGGNDFSLATEPVLACLETAVSRVSTIAAKRLITLEIALTDETLCAIFDPRGLTTCLDHLLRNAIDYTCEGGTVTIDAKVSGDCVDVSVFNRGDAPDPGEISRLMQPFEQGTTAHNRTREGAGLGWAIVRLTARAMGGQFGVKSISGESLTAIVRLKAEK